MSTFSFIGAQFTGQAAIAATAIDHWRLRDVAMLGAGYPTPLTPKPSQVLYYTDSHPEVEKEATRLGYNTCKVDVTQLDDLKQLKGASTAIATGLYHLLSDTAVQQMMQNFTESGFRTVVFNQINPDVPDALVQNWTRMGFTVYKRRPADISALMQPDWRVEEVLTARNFLVHHPVLGPQFAELEELNDIYLVGRP
jgi:hypothetical protein